MTTTTTTTTTALTLSQEIAIFRLGRHESDGVDGRTLAALVRRGLATADRKLTTAGKEAALDMILDAVRGARS